MTEPDHHHEPVVLTGDSLSVEQVARVARDPAVKVRIDQAALDRVRRGREQIERIVEHYHETLATPGARVTHVYGVTTGFGEFKDEPVPPEQLVELQQNILLSHASGAGDTPDECDPGNYHPPEVVRAALSRWPGRLRAWWIASSNARVRPQTASSDIAVVRSATFARCSASCTASASVAAENVAPFVSAKPSLYDGATGSSLHASHIVAASRRSSRANVRETAARSVTT